METSKTSTAQSPQGVECFKCHKSVAPDKGKQEKKGFICNDCLAKAKRNRLIAIIVVCVCLIGGAIAWIFASKSHESRTATGFDGVTEINDSVNVEMDSVNVEFNLATATISSSPVSTQAPINNLSEFKRVVAQNVDAAKAGKANDLNIPVAAIMFSFKSAELTPEAQTLIKEYADLYNQTSKEKKIEICGYACNIGEDAPNDYISQQRAEAVKNAFVSNGVDELKLTTKWFGKSMNSEFNLPKNEDYRRVLITIE